MSLATIKPISKAREEKGLITVLVKLKSDRIGTSRGSAVPTKVRAHPVDSILRLKERIVEAMALDELDDSSSSPLVSAEALQLIHRGKKMRNTKSGVEQTLRDYQVLNGCLLVVSAAPWLPGSSDGTELAGPTRPGLPNQPRPKTLHNGWSSASRGVTGRTTMKLSNMTSATC